MSIFEKMQLYYTRKLKTQLTNPRLPQTGAESYLAPGFFIPPSALMRDGWGRVSTGTVICAHWAPGHFLHSIDKL